jgi:peptidoglycan hydrolase-like protein with peptidoglycan-binding domain
MTRLKVMTGLVIVVVTGVAAFLKISGRTGDAGAPTVTHVPIRTADVRRTDVAERRHVDGTLGYMGSYRVIAPGPGTLTWVPAAGSVVGRGQPIYELGGKPVLLMYGARPAWRAFELGMTDGADVEQLENNLAQLGHGAGLTVDQKFNAATRNAIRRWQISIGLPVTGTIPLGQIVFSPTAIRIGAHDLQLGEQVDPGAQVEHGTSNQPAITVQLPTRQLPNTKVGDPAVIRLPNGATRTGRIAEIGAVTTPAGEQQNGGANQPTAPVTVLADGDVSGFVDQAQVQVAITVEVHRNVLAVPITALNALPGGEYDVVVVDGSATRHVRVRTGLFDETAGLAEVSGEGLSEGQKVRVPRDNA